MLLCCNNLNEWEREKHIHHTYAHARAYTSVVYIPLSSEVAFVFVINSNIIKIINYCSPLRLFLQCITKTLDMWTSANTPVLRFLTHYVMWPVMYAQWQIIMRMCVHEGVGSISRQHPPYNTGSVSTSDCRLPRKHRRRYGTIPSQSMERNKTELPYQGECLIMMMSIIHI